MTLVQFIISRLSLDEPRNDRNDASRQWNSDSEHKRAKNVRQKEDFKLSRAQVERPQRQVFKMRGKVGERGAFTDGVMFDHEPNFLSILSRD